MLPSRCLCSCHQDPLLVQNVSCMDWSEATVPLLLPSDLCTVVYSDQCTMAESIRQGADSIAVMELENIQHNTVLLLDTIIREKIHRKDRNRRDAKFSEESYCSNTPQCSCGRTDTQPEACMPTLISHPMRRPLLNVSLFLSVLQYSAGKVWFKKEIMNAVKITEESHAKKEEGIHRRTGPLLCKYRSTL